MEVDSFLMQCIQHYTSFDIDSFESDFNRLKSIKKILCKYERTGAMNERLLLNHVIILYNMFDNHATFMLFSYIDPTSWKAVITILVYLNRMPNKLPIGDKYISDIGIDQEIVNKLRAL